MTPFEASVRCRSAAKTDLPDLSVRSCQVTAYDRHTQRPINTQPPGQNKAIVRPLKRRDPTVLPRVRRKLTIMSKISRRFHMSKAPGGAPRAGQVQQRHIGNCIRQ